MFKSFFSTFFIYKLICTSKNCMAVRNVPLSGKFYVDRKGGEHRHKQHKFSIHSPVLHQEDAMRGSSRAVYQDSLFCTELRELIPRNTWLWKGLPGRENTQDK